MNIHDDFRDDLPELLEDLGFDVVLEASTPGAGSDFSDAAETWATVATIRGMWERTPAGTERLSQMKATSETRLGLIVLFRDDLKDGGQVVGKRIVCDGTTYNIAAVAPMGFRVGLILTLEDGVAT